MGLKHIHYGNKKQKSKKKQIKNKVGKDSDPSSSVVAQRSGNHEDGHKRIITDSRFSYVHSDPRFQNVPKHRAKVPIDSRFDRMFVDKNFSSSATLDKRGKPKVEKSQNSLRHYYRIEDENEEEREQEESENDEEEKERITTGDKEEDEEVKGENRNLSLAEEDSSSELDTSSEEDAASGESEYEVDTDEDELDDVVYEEDVPVETVPEIEKETHRLAVLNMDWRYIKAEHLYMMLSSFLPKGGQILCVSVYPSEFGLQRMKEEEVHGPVGLFDDEEEKSDEEDGGEIDDEKLRAYELSRLRYYYAVVECDSVATADYLYKTCDGVEFERSSNVLDLRFIPDSMEFKHPPRDIATQAPGNYEAIDFHTSALQKSKIDLSWEEDEPQRVKKLKRKYDIDKDEQDFKEFLASEDSDTDLENEDQSGKKQKIEHDYRALMQSGSGSDEDDERGGLDMEVTFNSGLEDLSKRILEKKEKKSETVWEAILRKKQEKKKARKNKSAYSSEDDSEFSDQEAVEADDFFIEEPVVKRSKKEKEDKVQTTDKEAEASIAELELLLADGQDINPGVKGFNLKPKKIKERKGNKVKKAKKVLDEKKIPTVDYNDPRFSALFVSPLYALDPTDPQFKRSAAYARQMALKQQKGDKQDLLESQQRKPSSPTNKDDDTQKSELLKSKKEKYELSSLVRSIKMKSKQNRASTEVAMTKMDVRDRRLRSVDEEAKQRDSPPGGSKSIKKKHRHHLQKDIKVGERVDLRQQENGPSISLISIRGDQGLISPIGRNFSSLH